jgi:hypothetical protein
MKLVALELADGAGAVLVDAETGYPLPVEPGRFLGQADAEGFLRWLGEPCGTILHLRELARRWGEVRTHLPCPTCPEGAYGRVAPGAAQCSTCIEETERDRVGNHEREPGRNEARS